MQRQNSKYSGDNQNYDGLADNIEYADQEYRSNDGSNDDDNMA